MRRSLRHALAWWQSLSPQQLQQFDWRDFSCVVFLVEMPSADQLRERSRRCARILLRQLLQQPSLTIAYEASGKPYLPGLPFGISISHSDRYLLLAVDKDQVGVDVDYMRYPHKWRSVYHWIRSPAEHDALLSLRRFLQMWTTKEAVLKLAGQGLEYGMHNITLPCWESDRSRYGWRATRIATTLAWTRSLPNWRHLTCSIARRYPDVVQGFYIKATDVTTPASLIGN